MAVVTMRQLLESGVHFGHQTRRWNPKMKRFIFTERNGIYIIDLQQSLLDIDRAYEFVKETVAHGGTILFVGTKKQAQEAVAEQATRVGMPYVNQRWLGGMLTNFGTVNKRLQRLKELEEVDFDDVASSSFTKKELLMQRRERDKLARTLGGIRDMAKVPSAIWIVDTKKEHLAVAEARKLKIPVVAILDTNCDPDEVDFPIPGNDDAIRAVGLLTRVIADGVAEGLVARHGGNAAGGTTTENEPLTEWERELLATHEAEQGAAQSAQVAAESTEAPVAAAQHVAGSVNDAEQVAQAADAADVSAPVTDVSGADDTQVADNSVAVEATEVPAIEAPVTEAVEAAIEVPATEVPAIEAPAAEAVEAATEEVATEAVEAGAEAATEESGTESEKA